jgi:hypothetical protein
MASYDRKFEVIQPTLDRLVRKPLEVADLRLLDPTNTVVVPLIPGELVFLDSTYKWIRATDAAKPSFFSIEDRGDYGVQASRKLSAIMGGGAFECDTIVYNTAIVTVGAAVQLGTVNNSLSGTVNRAGLVASAGGLVLGYVTRPAATNGGLLRILQTLV